MHATMQVTLTHEQRNVLYRQIVMEVSAATDMEPAAIRDALERFKPEFNLLDQIGWEPEAEGATFELAVDPALLYDRVGKWSQETEGEIQYDNRSLAQQRAGDSEHFFIGHGQEESIAMSIRTIDKRLEELHALKSILAQVPPSAA